jgi:hypothetical protein
MRASLATFIAPLALRVEHLALGYNQSLVNLRATDRLNSARRTPHINHDDQLEAPPTAGLLHL